MWLEIRELSAFQLLWIHFLNIKVRASLGAKTKASFSKGSSLTRKQEDLTIRRNNLALILVAVLKYPIENNAKTFI